MYWIIVMIFLFSCNIYQHKKEIIKKNILYSDTVITYNIENISIEGAEAKAYYTNRKISFINIRVFGETGQASINYIFEAKEVFVLEKTYRYKKELTEVKSENDLQLESEIDYRIDYQGRIKGDINFTPLNIYMYVKDNIPFELK